jgi:hypothetical protein
VALALVVVQEEVEEEEVGVEEVAMLVMVLNSYL